MQTKLVTLKEFIERERISITAKRIEKRKENLAGWSADARHFSCILARNDQTLRVEFSQGSAWKVSPTAEDVINCMADDSSGVENARSFEDWASDYGYEVDSRKAEKIFRNVEEQAVKLKGFLGEELYEELLWNIERN